MSERGKVLLSGFWSWGYHWWTRKGNKSNLRFCATNIPFWHFIFGFLCRCVLSPAGWASTQSMPRWPRSFFFGLLGRLILKLKLKWRQTKYFFAKVDEERKVEAVKDFYENAVGNERVVERLQFISIPAYHCLILCLKTTNKKIAIEFVDSSTYLKLALLSTSVFQLVLEFPLPSLHLALSTGATVSPSIRSDQQLYNMHSK